MPDEKNISQIPRKVSGNTLSAAEWNAVVDAVLSRLGDTTAAGIRLSGGMHGGPPGQPFGLIQKPFSVLPGTKLADYGAQTDTWAYDNPPLGSEGVTLLSSRVVWDSTNGVLIAYVRQLTFDSRGQLGSVTAETAYQIATSEECDGTNSYANTDTTNTFTQPQTFQNGNNSNIKGGTAAVDQSNVSGTSDAHTAYYTDGNQVAGINGNGQYEFADHGGSAAVTFASDDDRAAQRDELGLGDAATKDVGTNAGEVAAGDHTHNVESLATAGTDTTMIFAPDGSGGVQIRAEAGGTAAATWGAIAGTLADQTDLQNALDAKVPYTGATATVDLGTHSLALTGDIASATAPASNVFASQINGTALGDAAWKNTGTNSGDVADGGSQTAHIAATGTNHGQVFGSSQTAGLAKSNPAGAIAADANGMFSFNTAGVAEETTIADTNFLTFTDPTGTAIFVISFDNFKACLPGTTATAADPWTNLTQLTGTAGVQLGTDVAAIVSCTTGVIEIYSIEMVNTDTTAQSPTFYYAGTNDANIFYPPLSISSGAKRVNSEKTSPIFVLESGQSLYGKATAASKINVVVQGIPKASSSFTMLTSVGLQLGTAAAAIIAAGTQVAEIHSINFADISDSSAATVTNYAFDTQTANIHSHPSIPANGCVRYGGDCPTILSSSGNFYSRASIANIINVMAVGKRRAS